MTLRTTTYAYDRGGRLTGVADPSSAYAYTYDNGDRLTGVDNLGTPGSPRVTLAYTYDADGNRTGTADNYNGQTSYSYDARDEVTRITQGQALGSGAAVAPKRVDLAYDAALRRTTLNRYADRAGTSVAIVTKGLSNNNSALSSCRIM